MDNVRFRKFLRSRSWSDDLRCFVEPASIDFNMPALMSWGELETYLTERAADGHVIQAAKAVWSYYKAHYLTQASEDVHAIEVEERRARADHAAY